MAFVIRNVNNNCATVGRLSTEFSHLLTDGGEINVEGDSALHSFQAEFKIPWYVTFHGKKKLAVRARDIIAGEK